ncbi:uncharacterized protein LOC131948463 [Physella acuta]|uniref:uncharacterized protein LOC131948463 n=1 Tax=Physella acuta TaxID=109671 RepID=UPI0027DCF081|nr:uncharacterized protein LOC131948463 [Physella acuta]
MDITNLTISNGSLAVVLKITGTAKEISDNQNSIAALTRSIQTGQQNVTFDNLPATATQVFINGVKFDAQASPCVQAALIQACQYPLVCVVLADNITTTCGSEPHSKNKQGLLIGLPVGLLLYWFLCVIIAALIYTFVKQRRKVKTTDFNDVMLFDESLVPLDSFPKKKLQGLENPAMTEQSTGTNGSTEQQKM